MPCTKCPNGKYKFGNGKCQYKTLEDCRKVERAYYAKKSKPKKTKKKYD